MRQVDRAAESDLFSDKERVAIEYAEAMTVTGQKVTDELFERVGRHFSEPENFRSKFNTALGIEAQGFCVLE
ncbi:MAG: hypothetical protein AUH81_13000 [Candidatus Rokubacteria bacterium 13_1_40CM_4_69_5]|nr:MAG: hypothetical protein AUH81_13000 [Candidatus Rokubacteria bacterium 13_1_40CM_4_69_5]